MTEEEIAVRFESHRHQIESLKHRMDSVEAMQKNINKLTLSVQDLATNMGYMLDEQKEQGKRLEALEKSRFNAYQYWIRVAAGCAATGIIGYILGLIFR